MAVGDFMIQFEVTQSFPDFVNNVEPIEAEAFEFLSEGSLVVREIAAEKYGGILAKDVDGVSFVNLNPFVEFVLVFADARKDQVIFYGPSCVASPPVTGAGLAILRVADWGLGPTSQKVLSVARTIGAHAYAQET